MTEDIKVKDGVNEIKDKGVSHKRKVNLYTHEGKFVRSFGSTMEAARELGIPQSTVSATANKKVSYNVKYYLRFEGEEAHNLYLGHQIKVFNGYGDEVLFSAEDGTETTKKFNTFEDAFKAVGLNYTKADISAGYKKSKGGYQFVREPHEDLVVVQKKYIVDNYETAKATGAKKVKKVFNTLEDISEFVSNYVGLDHKLTRERVRQVVASDGRTKLKGFSITKTKNKK